MTKILKFPIRKIFQRVCSCGHSPVAHEHYSRDTSCAVCRCTHWQPKGWRIK